MPIQSERRTTFRPRPLETVTDWCLANVRFSEPQNHGPFQIFGREYIREPLDSWGLTGVHDLVMVFGSQTGKTASIMAGVAWTIINSPPRAIWVMPNLTLAQTFSETRWQPMLRASPETARLIPTGANRFAFKKCQQQMGGAVVNFFGSNSPANLASTPANLVVLDEVDKFDPGGGEKGEANAVELAEQRAKTFANAKRVKVSTPTSDSGLIWREYLKGDCRRYYVPCPHCSKDVVLVWSDELSKLPKVGCEAYVTWDPDAKVAGKWDLAKVKATAHAVCPHCQGKIEDGHKTAMIRAGRWVATNAAGAPGFRSYHLSSLYANDLSTTFGNLAVKFLQAQASIRSDGLNSLQGFVNGDLAEPWEDVLGAVRDFDFLEARRVDYKFGSEWPEETVRFMSADRQEKGGEHYWWLVRAYAPLGKSRLVAYGKCYTQGDLEELRVKYGVNSDNCMIDTGGHFTSDTYSFCISNKWKAFKGDQVDGYADKTPTGKPIRRLWRKGNIDPSIGKGGVGLVRSLPLFQFATSAVGDRLFCFMRGLEGDWQIPKGTPDDYLEQVTAEIRIETRNKLGQLKHEWKQIRPDNHLLDCERMILVAAIITKCIHSQDTNDKPA